MNDPCDFTDRLARAWPAEQWAGRGVLVAVSGGADSVALLRALVAARPTTGSGRLVVGHVNHGLRGAEADDDQQFVRSLADRLGVEFRALRADTQQTAVDEGDGLEAAARTVRYALLRHEAEALGARYVAVAHTVDDQAETVLHRVLRGTGLAGLRGMRRSRPLGEAVALVRPLLGFRRAELRAYLAAIDQPFREDSSNADRRFTRNRLRHDLLPMAAEHYNPEVIDALVRLGHLAGEAQDALEQIVDREIATAARAKPDGSVSIDCRVLGQWPAHLRREAMKRIWQAQGWPMQSMGYAEWQALASFVSDTSGARRIFPGAIAAERHGAQLCLERIATPTVTPAGIRV